MKKRIALFANGWNNENVLLFINGLQKNLPECFVDIFTFISYESFGMPNNLRLNHGAIFTLPDLSTFDAAIVFYPGLNFSDSINYIYDAIDKANIPAISIGNKRDGYINISGENYSGMFDLCNHLIDKHGCKNIVYLAGSDDNSDSNERLLAITDSLKNHGLNKPIVHYTNWETANVKLFVQEHYSTKETVPDAIICANDTIATFAVITIEENGLSVPDDVIVTGFDHTTQGRSFYPGISSVDQHFSTIGEVAAKNIVAAFNGETTDDFTSVPCSFYASESCGCFGADDSEQIRKSLSHQSPYRNEYEYHFSTRMVALENAFLQTSDFSEMKKNVKKAFKTDSVEGPSFFMMADPELANIGKYSEYTPVQFCDVMDVMIAKYNSNILECTTCDRKQLVPYIEEAKENLVHLFSPFYLNDRLLGYIVCTNNSEILQSYKLYDLGNKIDQILVSLKRNLELNDLNQRLSELMEQDTLTRVKNRTAYEKYLKKLERDFDEGENGPFAVIYFDINNLKMVNDMYGHEKGDSYIKNSCRLICNTFKHSPVFRIGGDEFVSIVINSDYENRHELLSSMKEHMDILKSKGDTVPLTERVSIASGMAEYDRTLDEDFASIFKRADEIMYENKYKMKKAMD